MRILRAMIASSPTATRQMRMNSALSSIVPVTTTTSNSPGVRQLPAQIHEAPDQGLPPGDDFNNFQPVAGFQLVVGEFGGCNGLPVQLNNNTSRQQILRDEELLEGGG